MISLIPSEDKQFGLIVRPVRLDKNWPGPAKAEQAVYAGPVILTMFEALFDVGASEDFIDHVVASAMFAGSRLNDWDEERTRAFQSAAWRSAHKFIVKTISQVDRGREIEELARALKIKL